uniref:glutaminyl-peptide cyclotransferase n=1 Tax=Oncorhynchus mykiss TaxID=8022 RepID=A0A8L0DPE3_ONCMY
MLTNRDVNKSEHLREISFFVVMENVWDILFQHMKHGVNTLHVAWTVELDSFLSPTPRGQVTFSNIIATLDPGAPRRLLLTCHYDSKVLPLDPCVPALNQQASAVTLQLVFFDGEESFEEWTATLYGSRHLAEGMAHTPHPLGVHVLHVIATPFPLFWYTLDDTEENIHQPTVENLTKVLAEYLGF